MAKNLDAKCKLCRCEGIKLFLKGEKCFGPKCPIVKRNYPPGVHGPQKTFKKSLFGYAKQLREKQKAKRIYRLGERQFKNYVLLARKKTGDAGKILRHFLELRLDNVLYRGGLANSRDQAKQFINHGLIRINNKKIDIPSYQLRVGDEITFKDTFQKTKTAEEIVRRLEKYVAPPWLDISPAIMSVKVISTPELESGELLFDTKPIIEFYSR